jgi:uncharacterized phiE125 gp8 family phage protein
VSWDCGISWFTRRTVAPVDFPVSVSFLRDLHVRAVNGGVEDEFFRATLAAATQAAEHDTQRALMPQTWEQVMSGFPTSGYIVLERPPLVEITSVAYYDEDNAAQTLAGSPAEYRIVPSGAYSKAQILPLAGETFPTTYARPDAVTITYECGYEDTTDPELVHIGHGIALMVGELYKQRTLSVQSVRNTPSVLDTRRFWRRVW